MDVFLASARVGKRTGAAALRMAVEMTRPTKSPAGGTWKITRDEAIMRITEEHLDQVLHPQFAGTDMTVIATGLAASPGAAVGRVYFTADDAADAADRGEKVILVRSENGYLYGYAGADRVLVTAGERVVSGTTLGTVGFSPAFDSAMVLFTVWRNNRYVDPETVPRG